MNSIHISAAVIINSEGKTLLVRKAGTQAFMQAGGKIDRDESPRQALERELLEELGIGLASEPRHLGQFREVAANELNTDVIAELFAVELNGEPHVAREIEECVWVSYFEAQTLALAPLTRNHVLPILEAMT